MNKRIDGLTFTRVVCTFGIITYHSSRIFAGENLNGFFGKWALSAWGNLFVTVFFALSGVGLYLNNHGKINVLEFYKKRVNNVYISFWLVWGVMYITKAVRAKSLFYAGRPFSILLSIIGMDGYAGGAYYFIGEWFLGALIILYMLYPILNFLFMKAKWKTSFLLGICYMVCMKMPGYELSFRSIFTCLVSFWIGMLIGSYIEHINRNWIVLGFTIDLFWHLYTNKFQLDAVTWSIITGISFFVSILIVGELLVPRNRILEETINFLGGISFQMFLVHHLIISKFNDIVNKHQWHTYLEGELKIPVFCALVLFVILCGWVLKLINDKIISTYKRISLKRTEPK